MVNTHLYHNNTFAMEIEGVLVNLFREGMPVSEAVNPAGYLVPANEAFMAWFRLKELATTELFKMTVELTTGKCNSPLQLWEIVQSLGMETQRALMEMGGLAFIGGGTHPLISGEEMPIIFKQAYLDQLYIWGRNRLLRSACTFGLHTHVFVGGEEKKNRWVINISRIFIPSLVGLFENSPFDRGQLAGVRSNRQVLTTGYGGPMTGIPETMSVRQFNIFLAQMQAAGFLDSRKKLWHFLLAHPVFKTVEVRLADTPLNWEVAVHETLLLAALISKIASYYTSATKKINLPEGKGVFDLGKAVNAPTMLVESQRQQATRWGLDAVLPQDFFTGQPDMPVRESLRILFDFLREDEELMLAFSLERTLTFFERWMSHGTQVDRQLAFFNAHGANEVALHKLITELLVPEMAKPLQFPLA